ncbi:Periplasmic beta-glucosidase precursor [Serratia marcescens]|uniref:Periplasmic beta-glucosidase n=1 Tax=Serratia marcescens TaxID=615 RepID=A0A380AIU4_SERMA|nr:Periplasmic beta-glucosidase precursor [Serratia marcescens]
MRPPAAPTSRSPQSQRDLIAALKATGKPLVLVLMNGRPLALSWESEQADAMLETWYSGTEGGNAGGGRAVRRL